MFLWPLKCYPAHDDALKCALRLRTASSGSGSGSGRKYVVEAAVGGKTAKNLKSAVE